MSGAYQPPLPQGNEAGHFIGTSTYKYPWQFLQMPAVGTVSQFKEAASDICSKSFNDIVLYDATLTYLKTTKHSSLLPYYCFLSSYIVVLLEDGYRFTENNTLSAQDVIKGNQVSWPYGAMLYEVNSLPFKMVEPDEIRLMGRLMLAGSLGMVVGIIIVGGILSQFLHRPHERPSSDSEVSYTPPAPAASSFYHDLARIYHGSSGGGGRGGGSSGAGNGAGTVVVVNGRRILNRAHSKISQYSPFADQSGDKETSALLAPKRSSHGAGSVDSNSSTDTVNVLKAEAMKNNDYQSIEMVNI
jgi:hypothetical protein